MVIRISLIDFDRFKRKAKALGRKLSIPHSEALDKIAQQQGFANWSLLAKHADREPTVSHVVVLPSAAKTRRYYLHGDQKEENAEQYFCARCDLFVTSDHFDDATAHALEEHGERLLNSLGRWKTGGLPGESYRDEDVINILTDRANRVSRARASYERSRSPFNRWLIEQVHRADPVGDLARDARSDKQFPVKATTLRGLKAYLSPYGGHVTDALHQAWQEYSASHAAVPE